MADSNLAEIPLKNVAMNYAQNALVALRYATIKEYVALHPDERDELVELLTDWVRITNQQSQLPRLKAGACKSSVDQGKR